ncbi:hypothetical protein [Exiguobacterium sp. s161]|uniref:hypothetical protein n=1 Tax=Exiguobacterium sp. s161 TaxID=2751191 RepID=UPI001BE7B3F6|nr:hypothetical protein [Exiguobacterium sp. s161]
MKKHTKKLLSLGLSAALVAPLVLSNQGLVNAVEAPKNGKIKFVALDDTKGTFVKSKEVKLTKLDTQTGKVVGLAEAWVNAAADTKTTSDAGEATFENVTAGKYALTMTVNATTTVTRFVTYAPKATELITKVTALPALADVDKKVSGAIGGTIKGANATTTVAIVGKDATWTTKADANGVFNVFLPAGTYDVIVVGKDTDTSTDDKKNTLYKAVKVQAGQTSSPLEQMDATVAWANGEKGFKFTESKVSATSTSESFSNISKEYKGTVDRDAIISAYAVDEKGTEVKTDDVYTLLAETTAKYDSKKATPAPFSLKVPAVQPGKIIKVIVRDTAANTFEKDFKFDLLDPKFKEDSTKAEIGQPIDITFTDVTKTLGSDKLVVKVKVKGADDNTYKTLVKSTGTTGDKVKDYSVASGKITINAAYFVKNFAAKAQDYTFSIVDTGFDTTKSTIDQKLVASTAVAPALTVVAEKGTTGTKLKVTATAETQNKIIYAKSSTAPTAPKLYSEVANSTEYKAGDEITGVDAKTTKYLAVYEVNAAGQVLKYKALTLTDKQVVAADAAALTASLSAGAEGKTKVTLPETGKFKYAKVASAGTALTKPKVGDAATTYATAIVNAAEVSVAAGDRLYVVEVDSSSKITKWVELTVKTADIGVAP